MVVYPGEGQAYPEELISIIIFDESVYAKEESDITGIKNIEINKIVKIIKMIKDLKDIKKLLDIITSYII